MDIASKITQESKVLPGVTFTVRRLNQIQRAKRDFGLIEERGRYTELYERYKALPDDAEHLVARAKLDHEMGLIINAHFKPAYIRAGLVSIEGYQIDGTAPSADKLIESGDELLVDEIYLACEVASGLSAAAQKNLPSPGTSDKPEGGQASSSIAGNASSVQSTGSGAV